MVTASSASASSLSTRTGYTYINALVTGATQQGLYSIVVDSNIMDDGMATGLTTTYGYNVTSMYDAIGSYKRYKIAW
jgi:hypothetical protein